MRVCPLRSRPSWTAGCADGPRILILVLGVSTQSAVQDGQLRRGVSSASIPTVQSAVLDGRLRKVTSDTNLLTATQHAARRPRRRVAQRDIKCTLTSMPIAQSAVLDNELRRGYQVQTYQSTHCTVRHPRRQVKDECVVECACRKSLT